MFRPLRIPPSLLTATALALSALPAAAEPSPDPPHRSQHAFHGVAQGPGHSAQLSVPLPALP